MASPSLSMQSTAISSSYGGPAYVLYLAPNQTDLFGLSLFSGYDLQICSLVREFWFCVILISELW